LPVPFYYVLPFDYLPFATVPTAYARFLPHVTVRLPTVRGCSVPLFYDPSSTRYVATALLRYAPRYVSDCCWLRAAVTAHLFCSALPCRRSYRFTFAALPLRYACPALYAYGCRAVPFTWLLPALLLGSYTAVITGLPSAVYLDSLDRTVTLCVPPALLFCLQRRVDCWFYALLVVHTTLFYLVLCLLRYALRFVCRLPPRSHWVVRCLRITVTAQLLRYAHFTRFCLPLLFYRIHHAAVFHYVYRCHTTCTPFYSTYDSAVPVNRGSLPLRCLCRWLVTDFRFARRVFAFLRVAATRIFFYGLVWLQCLRLLPFATVYYISPAVIPLPFAFAVTCRNPRCGCCPISAALRYITFAPRLPCVTYRYARCLDWILPFFVAGCTTVLVYPTFTVTAAFAAAVTCRYTWILPLRAGLRLRWLSAAYRAFGLRLNVMHYYLRCLLHTLPYH